MTGFSTTFCFYDSNITASNENHIVKHGTSQNKQDKYQRYLYPHFTKDKRHRKTEFCDLDLTSPQQNQISR